jgi:pSer/pThr/pTyr-binding forkhead associated (FHA) protein
MNHNSCIIEVFSGPGAGTRIIASTGKQITVGRSNQADYSFPENLEMSRVHFAIKWNGQEWLLNDLGSSNGTYLNKIRVMSAALQEGDQVTAGQGTFSVSFNVEKRDISEQYRTPPKELRSSAPEIAESPIIGDSSSNQPTVRPAVATGSAAGEPIAPSNQAKGHGFSSLLIPQICSEISQLSDDAKSTIQDGYTPTQFVEELTKKNLFIDAILFLAHALCKRDAVVWACDCVNEIYKKELEQKDRVALIIAREWANEPDDKKRLVAKNISEELKFATPASWVAGGAFWSDGPFIQSELAALPELPEIPILPNLTAHAVSGAIMLAAVQKDPEKAPEKYQQFIEMGIKMGVG